MSAPAVSICVPTFDGASVLQECLESALNQTFTDFELLIVDDASKDETVAIASRYARLDSRVRVVTHTHNLGLSGNWNRCIDLSRGQWLKYLFQDDRLEPKCLSDMLQACVPGTFLVACRRTLLADPSASPKLIRVYESYVAEHNLPRRFPGMSLIPAKAFASHMVDYPVANCIGEPTAILLHREAFNLYGRYHPDLVQLIDWEYAARIAVHRGLCYVDTPLITFRIHERSSTSLNQTGVRSYRSNVIDPLLILHELAYSPVYEPVRQVSSQRQPPVDLQQRLIDAVDAAARSARDDPARQVWTETLQRYPRLASAPPLRRLKRWATSHIRSLRHGGREAPCSSGDFRG